MIKLVVGKEIMLVLCDLIELYTWGKHHSSKGFFRISSSIAPPIFLSIVSQCIFFVGATPRRPVIEAV